MRAAAAQEDLDDLVDEQQGDGQADAEQPLAAAQRGQAQAPLQEAQLGRQNDEQQCQAVEHQLVSIVQDIPVERAPGFILAAETVAHGKE